MKFSRPPQSVRQCGVTANGLSLYVVQVVLALVGLRVVSLCFLAGDFAAHKWELLFAVQPFIDARQVRAALEQFDGLVVPALGLQNQRQSEQRFRQAAAIGALAGFGFLDCAIVGQYLVR